MTTSFRGNYGIYIRWFFKENPKGANEILITRLSKEKADLIKEIHDDMDYRPEARIGIVGNIPEPDGMGNILIATGGTRIFLLLKKLLLLQPFFQCLIHVQMELP